MIVASCYLELAELLVLETILCSMVCTCFKCILHDCLDFDLYEVGKKQLQKLSYWNFS